MKKLFCLILAVIMLSLSVMPIAAEDEGMKAGELEKYTVNKAFDDQPLSFEAWVSVPVGFGRAGVIAGNYSGSPACVNFEITTNGRPRLYVVEYTSGEKAIHDVTFKSVDIRSGKMTHVAIVHDPAVSKTYCYVDGELKETASGALNITGETCTRAFAIAGDCRGGNAQYFKGNIGEIALYTKVRTADEIRADMDGVDRNGDGLLAHYETWDIDGDIIKDLSGNGYDVTRRIKWLDSKEPVTDYAYSFCVVGDTQVVAEKYPDKLACIYDWIIENKEEKKIEFVFGLGDITNKNTDAEWAVAKEQIFKMNGVVPYSLVRGNHDGTAKINEYFAKLDYMAQFNGFYDKNKIDNSWRTFSVGETDYLLVTLDYGASDALLNWAAEIIEAHPKHKVIITTHAYMFRDGTTLDVGDVCPPNAGGANDGVRNNGDQMWDKLISKYENIFLVLSGHDPSDDVVAAQTKGVHGNVVTQILVDPQGVDAAEGATGMVAMLYFSEDGKTLTVENYSTVRDKYFMNTSQFTLPLPEDFHVLEKELDDSEKPPVETQKVETQNGENDAQNKPNVGADIGIIGGADGPTAIFIAGQIWPLIAGVALAVAAIGVAVGFIIGKRSKKN